MSGLTEEDDRSLPCDNTLSDDEDVNQYGNNDVAHENNIYEEDEEELRAASSSTMDNHEIEVINQNKEDDYENVAENDTPCDKPLSEDEGVNPDDNDDVGDGDSNIHDKHNEEEVKDSLDDDGDVSMTIKLSVKAEEDDKTLSENEGGNEIINEDSCENVKEEINENANEENNKNANEKNCNNSNGNDSNNSTTVKRAKEEEAGDLGGSKRPKLEGKDSDIKYITEINTTASTAKKVTAGDNSDNSGSPAALAAEAAAAIIQKHAKTSPSVPSTMPSNYVNADGIIVNDTDILCGVRCWETSRHPGTVQYRNLVENMKEQYILGNRVEKTQISKRIVNTLLVEGARFLMKSRTTGKWVLLGHMAAFEKTHNLLRKKTPHLGKIYENGIESSDALRAGREFAVPKWGELCCDYFKLGQPRGYAKFLRTKGMDPSMGDVFRRRFKIFKDNMVGKKTPHTGSGGNRWSFNYEQLIIFHKKHGNCNVPEKYMVNPVLAKWVSQQRVQYQRLIDGQNSSISAQHVDKLETLEFSWIDPKEIQRKLSKKVEQLRRSRTMKDSELTEEILQLKKDKTIVDYALQKAQDELDQLMTDYGDYSTRKRQISEEI